jgi:hypothetical protein
MNKLEEQRIKTVGGEERDVKWLLGYCARTGLSMAKCCPWGRVRIMGENCMGCSNNREGK